ncbi:HAD-IIA family hydrolase [Woodsholea maritima]|uniref:HAD-IIA family hydrolase n=1 Tax=Woodsholea maritima TaxID=240237 RepID=UPI00036D3B92|nr:HAD-IA family hydrolase [Woodsholea maritima]
MPADDNLAMIHPQRRLARRYQGMLDRAQGILLDWDGCIALANTPFPGAIEFLKANIERVAILSNNSTHRPQDLQSILAKVGVDIALSRVILAGVEALRHAQDQRFGACYVVGVPAMERVAREMGMLARDGQEVETVILMRDMGFSYEKLARTVRYLERGARLIVANPDLTHPGVEGGAVPETGALLAAVMACVDGQAIEMDVIGKPSPFLFHAACRSLDLDPTHVVMIGDNPATDIAGAQKIGMSAILIGPDEGVMLGDLM